MSQAHKSSHLYQQGPNPMSQAHVITSVPTGTKSGVTSTHHTCTNRDQILCHKHTSSHLYQQGPNPVSQAHKSPHLYQEGPNPMSQTHVITPVPTGTKSYVTSTRHHTCTNRDQILCHKHTSSHLYQQGPNPVTSTRHHTCTNRDQILCHKHTLYQHRPKPTQYTPASTENDHCQNRG